MQFSLSTLFLVIVLSAIAIAFCKWDLLLGLLLSTFFGCGYAAAGCLAVAKSLQDSDHHVQITLLLLVAVVLIAISMAACFLFFALAMLGLGSWLS